MVAAEAYPRSSSHIRSCLAGTLLLFVVTHCSGAAGQSRAGLAAAAAAGTAAITAGTSPGRSLSSSLGPPDGGVSELKQLYPTHDWDQEVKVRGPTKGVHRLPPGTAPCPRPRPHLPVHPTCHMMRNSTPEP